MLSLEVSDLTGDLVLTLDGGLTLTTFVSDPNTDELRHVRDNATKQKIVRRPSTSASTRLRYNVRWSRRAN